MNFQLLIYIILFIHLILTRSKVCLVYLKENSKEKDYGLQVHTLTFLKVDENDNETGGTNTSGTTTSGTNTSGTTTSATITGGTTLSHSTWYHACVTWDGDNINLYLNGVSDATQVAATTFFLW